MQFHNVRFPTDISLSSMGGPERQTDVVELRNGQELRRARHRYSRRRYLAGSGVKNLSQLYDIVRFYEARMGQLHGFRWKDWSDFSSNRPGLPIGYKDQVIGWGDDVKTQFQLQKTYPSGGFAVTRKITKPIVSTVRIGIEQRECEADEFEVQSETGVVQFHAPPEAGARIYAGFEFDVPVRFDCEALEINLADFEAGEIPNIPLIEILE